MYYISKSDLVAKRCLRSNICLSKRGFTLIELLIVVAIICVIGVASVGFYNSHLEDAKIAVMRTNMKLINDSISNYYKDNRSTYPKYVELELVLSSYLNRPVSELLNEVCNAENMEIYYRVMVPLKRTSSAEAKKKANTKDTSSWKSASEIADDSENRGQHMVKEITVSPTHP